MVHHRVCIFAPCANWVYELARHFFTVLHENSFKGITCWVGLLTHQVLIHGMQVHFHIFMEKSHLSRFSALIYKCAGSAIAELITAIAERLKFPDRYANVLNHAFPLTQQDHFDSLTGTFDSPLTHPKPKHSPIVIVIT